MKWNVTKQAQALWTVALALVALVFALDVLGVNLIGWIPGSWNALLLVIVALTLGVEVTFGEKGIQTKKPGDLFLVAMAIVAFLMALSVAGMIEIPSVIASYVMGVYALLVVALIYAVKVK